MADRHRSQDGRRETDQFIEDMPDTPDQQGRSGGQVARDVGTEDSLKRASAQGVKGMTRVTKSKERDEDGENGQ
ncbi:hypothetical protein [Jannaschia seohaensis]|uniref:Uncharacterized protein n=1 Tax=Jannaschia seohaensis TaxID=475081 RepID=A0A2Y9C2E2_9RHOB|nr:hypothetical protein [Jannaschia seohaensis]PWJ15848.1 hypothetical protein BCF38_11068 [Jannaschia seohaensis]SSA49552.1 hypothetical protein SAMN05421539_11068 [Jannaschia seohaensis]